MARVLADCHHSGLYESLRLLFEVRLGWELYRPIGLDWYSEGYWCVYPHPATAEQFLGVGGAEPLDMHGQPVSKAGDTAWVNKNSVEVGSGLYRVGSQKGITLERAKQEKWDIILSSIPQHYPTYEKFRQEYCPEAKHVFQMGNMWGAPGGCRNLLDSTSMPAPPGIHRVHYHQEFDLTPFVPGPCANPRSVLNLMHYQQSTYQEEWHTLKSLLSAKGWVFTNHGAGNDDGPCNDVPEALRNHGFLWHNKAGGEGYGYNAHQAAAAGRPIICHHGLFRGMQVSHLLEDSVRSIDMDGLSIERVSQRLEEAATHFSTYRKSVRDKFAQHVNFDREFVAIKQFLDNLQ